MKNADMRQAASTVIAARPATTGVDSCSVLWAGGRLWFGVG